MKNFSLSAIPEKELYPGFIARIIHTELQSISYVRCLEGAVLPEHHHEEEQVLNLIEGIMDVTVNGETIRCSKGDIVHIPSNARHTVSAITDCLAIDIFSPNRKAYLEYGVQSL